MHESRRSRIGQALVLGALLPTAFACATTAPEDEPDWNDTALLEWVSALADDESAYDDLETVQRFESLQRAIEEVKQLVLESDLRSALEEHPHDVAGDVAFLGFD